MMAFHQGSSMNDPLAAALAAAAALAKNGGTFLYESSSSTPAVRAEASNGDVTPLLLSSTAGTSTSPSPIHIASSSNSSSSSSNYDGGEQYHNDDDNISGSIENEDHRDNDATIGTEEDAERRMVRSRERNREHARRTRRRKKAQLEALQSKVQCLQAENKNLKQSLEECRIASILVGFSVSDGDDWDATIQNLLKEANEIEGKDIFKRLTGGKRTRFVSDASDIANNGVGISPSVVSSGSVSIPLKIEINGQTTVIGGDSQSHLNWKTGVYTNEKGIRILLTNKQLESLRRERNRMHAKMTRDRKKSFIAAIEKTIEELESSNKRMRSVLADVIHSQKPSMRMDVFVSSESDKIENQERKNNQPHGVTPSTSPATIPREKLVNLVPEVMPALVVSCEGGKAVHTVLTPMEHGRSDHLSTELHLPPKKRICHGFSLPY